MVSGAVTVHLVKGSGRENHLKRLLIVKSLWWKDIERLVV